MLLPDGTRIGDTTPANLDAVALARDGRQAFSQTTDDGVDVFTPVVVGRRHRRAASCACPTADITEGVTEAWAVLAGVALLLIAASVAVTDRLARSVTRPAADLARTSRDLAGGDASARAVVAGPPEIAAVAESLNLLADRIDELLTAERERVADLSHRLRTPLTALRLDAEGHGAAALVEDVDRLEAEVTELIRAARRPLARDRDRPVRPARGPRVTAAEDALRAEIVRRGPVPFAEVVELALYDERGGFYATGGQAGRRGDFLTSPEVGAALRRGGGEPLDAWWSEAGRPEVWTVVEAGAGPGTLARTVLAASPACSRRAALRPRGAVGSAAHAQHAAIWPSRTRPPPSPAAPLETRTRRTPGRSRRPGRSR